jgi:hypothetical protein
MNTKTKKARTKLYTDTMVTRVPPQMKEKFEVLCQAEYKSASEVIRSFIYEYVRTRDASLNLLALHGQPQKPRPRPAHEYDIRQPTSARPPSQQADENWDDWG